MQKPAVGASPVKHWGRILTALVVTALLIIASQIFANHNDLLRVLLSVAAAGAIGGGINDLVADDGGAFPGLIPGSVADATGPKTTVLHPGTLGNSLIGALAAFAYFALNGPYAGSRAVGSAAPSTTTVYYGLTLAGLISSVVLGMAGSRILSQIVDSVVGQSKTNSALTIPDAAKQAKTLAALASTRHPESII